MTPPAEPTAHIASLFGSLFAVQDYIAFSLLAILLHSLFLPADTASRIVASRFGRSFLSVFDPVRRRIALVAVSSLLLALRGRNGLWALMVMGLIAFVFAYARENTTPDPSRTLLVSPAPAVNVLVVLFFLNGLSPYLGFETGQSMSLFSNLHIGGGYSNHRIVRRPLSPPSTQDSVGGARDPTPVTRRLAALGEDRTSDHRPRRSGPRRGTAVANDRVVVCTGCEVRGRPGAERHVGPAFPGQEARTCESTN